MNATNWLTAEEESELVDVTMDLSFDLSLRSVSGELSLSSDTLALISELDRIVFERSVRIRAGRSGQDDSVMVTDAQVEAAIDAYYRAACATSDTAYRPAGSAMRAALESVATK